MTNQARLKKAGNKNKKSKKSVKRAPAKAKRYIAREHTFSVKIARKTIQVECIIFPSQKIDRFKDWKIICERN